LFISPLDVILKKDLNVVQPDLIYIKKENLSIFHPEGHIQGVPDLLIEIVSPSSVPRDTVDKFRIYESYGVNEYWIVFPEQKVIEVFTLEDGKYVQFCSTELAEDMAKSKVIPNLEIKNKLYYQLANLINECVKFDPDRRIEMTQVRSQLEKI
jgi:Uma2 family endonuclease